MKSQQNRIEVVTRPDSYQTKHKPDWARHYGSVHHYIGKYLQEYLDEKERPGGDVNTLDIVGLNPAANDQASSQENSLPQQQACTSAQATSLPVLTPSSTEPAAEVKQPITSVPERTYSAFLPKENLSAILSTAWEQQSQPQKNFGVVTVTGPVVNQISQQINGGQLLQQQQNGPLVQGPMQTSLTNKADVTEDLSLVMEQVALHATKIDP